MEKEFIGYNEALALKELGFDEPCFGYRDGGGYLIIKQMPHCVISTPTFSQAFRWFRKKYGLDSFVKHLYKSTIKIGYYFGIDEYKGIEFQMDLDDYYKTYEEAELECLIKLIKIVKNK